MITEEQIDIFNEPIDHAAEERLRLLIALLRQRVAYYEEQNAKLSAANDTLREENDRLKR